MSEVEQLLKQKVSEFGEFLVSICNSESKKSEIQNEIQHMKIEFILLFIMFLDKNKLSGEINNLIHKFDLIDTEENRNQIQKYIDYFVQVKLYLN